MAKSRSIRFTLVAAILLLFVFIALPASFEVRAEAASKDDFTIALIEPAEDGKTVLIQCSAPCRYDDLKGKFALRPFAGIDWARSYQHDEKTVVLAGRFKKKTNYSIVLPDGFITNGRTYKPTLTTFQFGNLPPKVEFADTRTVIERDSRQMLLASFINITELTFKGLGLPPVMAPMALAMTEMNKNISAQAPKRKKPRKSGTSPIDQKDPAPAQSATFDEISANITKLYISLRPELEARGIPSIFLGGFVQDSQVFVSPLDPDQQKRFSIPLTFRTGKEKGVIELVDLSGKDSAGRVASATRIFRITDIGITYKVSSEGILVWTTSLGTGKPLAHVRCLGYLNDGSFADLGATDDSGILSMKAIDPKSRIIFPKMADHPNASPSPADIIAVIAGTSNDVTYVAIDKATVLNPKEVPSSDPRSKQVALLKGAVFTERGIPGIEGFRHPVSIHNEQIAGFQLHMLRVIVHVRKDAHRDPAFLQKYRVAAVPPYDDGWVVAGICTGKRQIPGVKNRRKHRDKHAGRGIPGDHAVCRTERTEGISRTLKTRPYQRPRHRHEERRTHPFTGHIGDHKGPPAITERDNIVKVPADLHCRDHHRGEIKAGDFRHFPGQETGLDAPCDLHLLCIPFLFSGRLPEILDILLKCLCHRIERTGEILELIPGPDRHPEIQVPVTERLRTLFEGRNRPGDHMAEKDRHHEHEQQDRKEKKAKNRAQPVGLCTDVSPGILRRTFDFSGKFFNRAGDLADRQGDGKAPVHRTDRRIGNIRFSPVEPDLSYTGLSGGHVCGHHTKTGLVTGKGILLIKRLVPPHVSRR
jgi:hypothetical protein